jgi:hypothetical protein
MLRGLAAVGFWLSALGFWLFAFRFSLFKRLATKDGETFEDVEIFS